MFEKKNMNLVIDTVRRQIYLPILFCLIVYYLPLTIKGGNCCCQSV